MESFIVVMVTAPDEAIAERVGRILVEEKLVACANLAPGLRSLFFWQGNLCDEEEVLLIMKSRRPLFHRIVSRIQSLHPYDVPEVIALPILEGSEDYLRWVEASTSNSVV